MNTVIKQIKKHWDESKFLCVGLDPILEPSSAGAIYENLLKFNTKIIDATAQYVCAFKPNSAFYEAYGDEGFKALKATVEYIHTKYAGIPVILDAKRADIGKTNVGYAKSAFEYLKVDGITVNPYLGQEAVQPFLDYKDKLIIMLVKTSNPGSGEFQNLQVSAQEPLYQHIARQIAQKWNDNGNCAVVVGATYPEDLAQVRAIVGDMPILIPGIGTQGGDVKAVVNAGKDSRGQGMIINSSSAIIFNENPGKKAHQISQQIIESL